MLKGTGGAAINTETDYLTSVLDDEKILFKFKDLGLGSGKVVDILKMIIRDELLSEYDFDTLKPDAKGVYRIWVPDPKVPSGKKRLYAKNIDNLKEKVYQHLKGVPGSKANQTFKYVFEEAQRYELTNTTPERQISRNNTVARNNAFYKRFFDGTDFEKIPISLISVRDLDTFIRETMKKFRFTKSSRNALRTIINLVFKRALYMEWIPDNIAAKIIWKDYDRFLCSTAPISKRAFTDEEIGKMIKQDRERQEKDPSFITPYAHEFQTITAFRRGEICPLRWEDVDFERGTIYVHQEQLEDRLNNHELYIADYTKTHKDREYPIADQEEAFLRKLWRVHEQYYPNSPFLFPADTPNGCITCQAVMGYHRRLCEGLDIPMSNEYRRGPHAFRRTRITDVVNATGGNMMLAAQMYGNSPETIRNNYYTQDSIEKQRAALNMRKVL